jgi:hypothetical protein
MEIKSYNWLVERQCLKCLGIYDHFEHGSGFNSSLDWMWKVILGVIIHWLLLTLAWFSKFTSGN